MRATAPVLVASRPECALHRPFPGHPERPGRLTAALQGATAGGAGTLEVPAAERAALDALARVHDGAFAVRLRDACLRAPAVFDTPDNPVSAGTYRAAVAAVECVLAAAGAASRGEAPAVFVAARPPGHHARRSRAMGFCYFNNGAVAAEELIARGLGPVAIVDFDVHHGNGTQEHFWERSDVYFLSVHRYPFFPGSGAATEIGGGKGRGFTRNFPLASGADDGIFLAAVAAGLEEALAALRPSSWVISAGFDAHSADPLGGMNVSTKAFGVVASQLAEAAGRSPLVAVLEGGYHPEALRESVRAFVAGLGERARS